MTAGHPFGPAEKAGLIDIVQRTGSSPATAAETLGFTWRTVKDHLQRDIEFREALVEAQDVATARIEDRLYREAEGGNLGAIKMWLTNRSEKGRWVDERDRGAGGAHGGALGTPAVIIGTVREVLMDGDTRDTAIATLLSVPLPEALEVGARES